MRIFYRLKIVNINRSDYLIDILHKSHFWLTEIVCFDPGFLTHILSDVYEYTLSAEIGSIVGPPSVEQTA